MCDMAWGILVPLGANLALVIIAYSSLKAVKRQQKQSEKNLLMEIRYGLEGDLTQLRGTIAIVLGKEVGLKKLEDREKQYDKTINEIAGKIAKLEEELQCNWGIKEFFRRRLGFCKYREEK